MPQELDLTPDPRVLQMLGEINLQQWRCLAELIDNGIDGLLHAARSGTVIDSPEIVISVPTADTPAARVVVRDNGPGMSLETLENAVKAGWSGNNPLSNLGLFGMGFNIATARLGVETTVWTTRRGDPEHVGVRIDLDDLRTTRSFKVPRQTRAKLDHNQQGTEIIISRLKPEQRASLTKSNSLRTIRKQLARTYSALLTQSDAGRIRMSVNGTRIQPQRHCVWSDFRSVQLPDGTNVQAVEYIDASLAPRRYCTHCMRTLAADQESCPTASANCNVVESARRIKGWIGLQRYLDKTDFGIDFVRNGRKIEIGNKDLFSWSDGDTTEVEYPIDDPRNRGRFVGEVQIDHCRVSYTKDRFERDDPSWSEMVRVMRGDGPLRPALAKAQGYTDNTSPLYKLFQAFRRSSPQGKNGLWSRIMVVRDNDRAQQMAEQFANGDPDFLEDERWWQIVEEQDKEVLGDKGGSLDIPGGFLDDPPSKSSPADKSSTGGSPASPSLQPPAPPASARLALHELTRKYVHPTFRVEYEVQAFGVEANDPGLVAGAPWVLRLDDVATRTYAFLVNVESEIFQSTTMTPLDGLLTELAHRTMEFLKGQASDVTLAGILADFRRQYCGETRLDPQEIIAFANAILGELGRAIPNLLPAGQGSAFYDELSEAEQIAIVHRMATREVSDHKALINDGRFWEYAGSSSLRALFSRHPALFLDGHYWEDAYGNLDFGQPKVTADARERVKSKYDAYLGDALWLANQTPADLERVSRDTIIRATCSLRLLKPDATE